MKFHEFFFPVEKMKLLLKHKTILCNRFLCEHIFFCLRQHTYIEIFAEFLQIEVKWKKGFFPIEKKPSMFMKEMMDFLFNSLIFVKNH